MTRIMHICDFAAPYPGAFIRQLRMLEDQIVARGGLRSVLAFPVRAAGSDWVRDLAADGFDVVVLPECPARGSAHATDAIAALISERNPTIVHTHFGSYDLATERAVRRIRRTRGTAPALVWHYRTALEEAVGDRGFVRRVKDWLKYARAGRRIDLCVSVTRALAEEVVARGMPANRSIAVPAGCDTESFVPAVDADARQEARDILGVGPDDICVMHLGWHWYRKGGDVLADAGRILASRGHRNIHFFSVGAPADEVAAPVRRLEPTDAIAELYAASDIFVSASRSEGFGNGLVEAMSCGCVAVAAIATGQQEIFAGVSGVVPVEIGSARAVADGIEALVQQRSSWSERGADNRRHIEQHHSMRRWARDMANEYARICPELRAAEAIDPELIDVRDMEARRRAGLARYRVMVLVDCLLAGGAERVAVETAAELDDSRFEPHVVVTRGTGPLEQNLRDAQLPYTILNRSRRFDWAAWRSMVRFAEASDVIHAHKFGSNLWGALVSWWTNTPLIVHEHNFSARPGVVRRLIDRWVISRVAERVVCVSDSVADTELSIGVDPSRLVVVPNGVRSTGVRSREDARAILGLDADAFVMGIVGRLRAEKAHEVALQALAQVRYAGHSAQLCVVGDGPRRAELEAYAASLGLPPGAVHWAGECSNAAQLVGAFDLSLLTSHWEGMPLAALESMAAGVPVVATAVGALPQLLSDGCGLVAAPGDAGEIARHVMGCLEDRTRIAAMGEASKHRIMEHYSFERMVHRIEGLYLAAMAGYAGGALPQGRGSTFSSAHRSQPIDIVPFHSEVA